MEMGMEWYGIALLIAQADGQMEPGVSSTKNNQLQNNEWVGELQRCSPSHPTDPTAQSNVEEAHPHLMFTF